MIRNVKLSPDPKTWAAALQGFVDDVVAALNGPPSVRPILAEVRQFYWNDAEVDVALGFKSRPTGIIVLMCEEEGTETIISTPTLIWYWRSGYARIEDIVGLVNPSTRHRITIGVIP
jgi:hypothetical protein